MSPELPLITPLLSLSHHLAVFPADSKVGHAGTIRHSSSEQRLTSDDDRGSQDVSGTLPVRGCRSGRVPAPRS